VEATIGGAWFQIKISCETMTSSGSQGRQLVLLMSKDEKSDAKSILLQQSGLHLVKLPHPKGGIPVMFMQDGDDQLYDLQSAAPRKHASWFINQRVSSDPSFYMASRIDPRFLVLPYLEKAGARFSPLDQIVTVADSCARLSLEKAVAWGLHELCDINDKFGDDMILYRHNEAKALEWLRSKATRTARVLAAQRIKKERASNSLFVGSFNVAAQSAQSGAIAAAAAEAADSQPLVSDSDVGREETRVALQIVCDYLNDATATKLVESFDMRLSDLAPSKAQETQLKRKADWEQELELEKETLAYAPPLKPSLTTASSSSSGTATGSSSSSSFSTSASGPAKKKPSNGGKAPAKPVAGKASIASFFGKK